MLMNAASRPNRKRLAPDLGPITHILEGDTTFFVRSDGNDANSGLLNTPSGAFRTLNGAYAAIAEKYFFNGFVVTLMFGIVGDTITGGLAIDGNGGRLGWLGGGQLVVDLNGGTLLNSAAFGTGVFVTQTLSGQLFLQTSVPGGVISAPSHGTAAVFLEAPGTIIIGNNFLDVDLNAQNLVQVNGGGFFGSAGASEVFFNGGSFTDRWSSNRHTLFAATGLGVIHCSFYSITFSGNPTIDPFVGAFFASGGGEIQIDNTTFTGATTGGLKGLISSPGSVLTWDQLPDKLPGAGSLVTANNGAFQYDGTTYATEFTGTMVSYPNAAPMTLVGI